MTNDRVHEVLARRGFTLLEDEVSVLLGGVEAYELDGLLERDGRTYLEMVREIGNVRAFLNNGLARAYMTMEAVRREMNDRQAVPLIVLLTEAYSEEMDKRLRLQRQKYTPDYEFLVITEGTGECAIDTAQDYRAGLSDGHAGSDEFVEPRLSFTDLDLWLTKFLLYQEDPPAGWAYEADVSNANQLAARANVSIDKSYSFSRELISHGHLQNETPAEFRIHDPEGLMTEWQKHYTWEDNKLVGRFRLPVQGEILPERVVRWLKQLPEESREAFVVTRGLAERVDTGPREVESPGDLYFIGADHEELADHGLEAVESDGEADVRIWEPDFPEAVRRAALDREGVRVADPLQRSLDS